MMEKCWLTFQYLGIACRTRDILPREFLVAIGRLPDRRHLLARLQL